MIFTASTEEIASVSMSSPWVFALMTMVSSLGVAIVGAGGFWSYLNSRDKVKKATLRLLLGLAHDRIIFLGTKYIDNKTITTDEYEDLMKYLWEPYSEFGGNGLAERVVHEVKNLPIKGMVNPVIRKIEENHEQAPDIRRAGDADGGF